MNGGHDDRRLEERIGRWLSDELGIESADALIHELAGDSRARRIAGDLRRVDADVRHWYQTTPLDRLAPTARHGRARSLPTGFAAAIVVVLSVIGHVVGERSDRAVVAALDVVAERVVTATGPSPSSLEPCSYGALRALVAGGDGSVEVHRSGTRPVTCAILRDGG